MELSIQEGAQLLEQRMEFVCRMIAECSTLLLIESDKKPTSMRCEQLVEKKS